jgi:hypothetical protein
MGEAQALLPLRCSAKEVSPLPMRARRALSPPWDV